MTNERILDNFTNFIEKNDINRTYAAEQLGISKGQMTHILKGERSISTEVAIGMRKMMGENVMSFEECSSKYPLGGYFVLWAGNATLLFHNNVVPRLSKDEVRNVEDLYELFTSEMDGLDFSFAYKDPRTGFYAVGEMWGFRVASYATDDGITFRPILERGQETYGEARDCHLKIMPLLYADFSNLKQVWEKVCEKIGTEYEFYFTREEFEEEGK